MNREETLKLLEENPVIAAAKDEAGLALALESPAKVVFVLFGSVASIGATVQRIRGAGKAAMVHVDLIDGLSSREAAVEFIAGQTEADGVLSTRANLVRRARGLGLCGIRRFFLLDSMALASLENQMADDADLVEVLPGVMPKVLRRIAATCPVPLVAGGLIADKEDVVGALSAGAVAVSTTRPEIWGM